MEAGAVIAIATVGGVGLPGLRSSFPLFGGLNCSSSDMLLDLSDVLQVGHTFTPSAFKKSSALSST